VKQETPLTLRPARLAMAAQLAAGHYLSIISVILGGMCRSAERPLFLAIVVSTFLPGDLFKW